jgi:hypothetical protein
MAQPLRARASGRSWREIGLSSGLRWSRCMPMVAKNTPRTTQTPLRPVSHRRLFATPLVAAGPSTSNGGAHKASPRIIYVSDVQYRSLWERLLDGVSVSAPGPLQRPRPSVIRGKSPRGRVSRQHSVSTEVRTSRQGGPQRQPCLICVGERAEAAWDRARSGAWHADLGSPRGGGDFASSGTIVLGSDR